MNVFPQGGLSMTAANPRSFFRAFLDFFILFSGVSTASNLSRTQDHPVRRLGLFLFRPRASKTK
jgi:hypothetical protein